MSSLVNNGGSFCHQNQGAGDDKDSTQQSSPCERLAQEQIGEDDHECHAQLVDRSYSRCRGHAPDLSKKEAWGAKADPTLPRSSRRTLRHDSALKRKTVVCGC